MSKFLAFFIYVKQSNGIISKLVYLPRKIEARTIIVQKIKPELNYFLCSESERFFSSSLLSLSSSRQKVADRVSGSFDVPREALEVVDIC